MRVGTSTAMRGVDACQHAFIWHSRQASERVWLERKGTMGEHAVSFVKASFVSILGSTKLLERLIGCVLARILK